MATIGEFIAKLGFKIDKKSSQEFDKSFKDKEKSTKKFGEEFKKTASTVIEKTKEMAKKVSENSKKLNEFTNKVILKTKEMTQKAMLMSVGFYGVLSGITFGASKLIRNYMMMDRAVANSNAPPKLEKQSKIINDISKNVENLKKTFANFFNWIGYFLVKDLQEPLAKVNNFLVGTDKLLKNNIKKSAENVAKFLGYFFRLLVNNLQFVIMFVKKLTRFFLDVAKGVDKVKFAWIAFTALLLINPMFALFTGLMLLIDDFIVHINGGESALGELWDKLISWYKELENSGAIEKFKENLSETLNTIGGLIQNVFEKTKEFLLYIANNKTAVAVLKNIVKLFISMLIIGKVIGFIQVIITVLTPIVKILLAILSPLGLIEWAILAIIGVIVLLVKHWDKVKKVAVKTWEAIKTGAETLKNGLFNIFNKITDKVKEITDKIKGFFVNAFKSAKEKAGEIFNKVTFGIFDKKKDNTTQGKASGGIVSSEGTYRIAENNQPEAIIPLSLTKRGRAIDIMNRASQFMNIPKFVYGANGINRQSRGLNNFNNVSNNSYSININVTGNQNPSDIAREVEKTIKKLQNNSLIDKYKNGIQMSNVGGNVI